MLSECADTDQFWFGSFSVLFVTAFLSVFVLLNLHSLLQLLIRQVLQIFNLRFQICDVIIGLQRADNFLVSPLIQVLGEVGTDQLGQFLDELPLFKKFLTLNDCWIFIGY